MEVLDIWEKNIHIIGHINTEVFFWYLSAASGLLGVFVSQWCFALFS